MADDQGFDWSSLIGPAVGVGAGLLGRSLTQSPQQATQAAMPPELSQLLRMGMQRTQYQNPLFQATSQQAFQGLPSYAREGLSMPTAMPAMPQGSAPSGGGMPEWLKLLLAGGAGAAGRSLLPGSGSGGDIGKLIKSIAGLFHGGNFGTGSEWSGLPSYDPFSADPFTGMPFEPMGLPSDPSGGSGLGPGMQAYYGSNTGNSNPWDE
jgi:hypothetical protein